jgi:hypothetical protein
VLLKFHVYRARLFSACCIIVDNMKLMFICILRVLLSHSFIFFRFYFFQCIYGFIPVYKVLRSIVNAPWYVQNTILHTDQQISTVKAEITNFSTKYREKLTTHPNELIPALLEEEEPRRLKRFQPSELTTRFSQGPYHRHENIWCENIQWNITPQDM